MRRHRKRLACLIGSMLLLPGMGCAPKQPAPALTDRPVISDGASVTYLQSVQVDENLFRAPAGQIRVFTTTRAALDAARRPAADDFDNSAHPLFYMGSDADWDYYYLADHAFAFFRVARDENRQDNRIPLTGDSLAWREVKAIAAATTGPQK